jgi:hypothetical protein
MSTEPLPKPTLAAWDKISPGWGLTSEVPGLGPPVGHIGHEGLLVVAEDGHSEGSP